MTVFATNSFPVKALQKLLKIIKIQGSKTRVDSRRVFFNKPT